MADSCVILVGDDGPLISEVRSLLEQQIGFRVLTSEFDTVHSYLDRDSDGLLVVVLQNGQDVSAFVRLVRDVSLQQFPVGMILTEEQPCDVSDLGSVRLYLESRLKWPDELERLARLVKSRGSWCQPFRDPSSLSFEEVLRRQLLTWTPSLVPLAERIALTAHHEVTVLMTGETGTGKTYCARMIHDHSPRKDRKFMHVACGAITANLIESEFFGHTRGAFTGADRQKIGKFEAVGSGTLLLDEIDTLGLEQQAALLRVIETGEFEPVGSVETKKCQARLIFASNVNLEEAVQEGTFRADLYFRLNVMSFHLPPLRERIKDISPLAQKMTAHFNRKFHKQLFDIHPETMTALESFPWPGNIRQLENAVQHAVLLSNGPELLFRHLPEQIQEHMFRDNFTNGHTTNGENGHTLDQHKAETEREVIQDALIRTGYSRSRAAEILGISRVTLYKKMKKYQLMDVPLSQGS